MNELKIAQLAESIKTLRWDIGLTSDQFFKLAYTNILTATLSLKNHTWFKVKENCCTKDTAIKKLELLKKQGYTVGLLDYSYGTYTSGLDNGYIYVMIAWYDGIKEY